MRMHREQVFGSPTSARGRKGLAIGFVAVGASFVSVGCVGPRMEIVAARCEPVQGRTGVEAVGFDAQVAAQGYDGEQFVYRVELYDAFGAPVRSLNDRFCNADGCVAASKTFMPMPNGPPIQFMRVAIPTSEMELSAENPPVQALFGLYRIDGACVARQSVALPQIGPAGSSPGDALAAAPREAGRLNAELPGGSGGQDKGATEYSDDPDTDATGVLADDQDSAAIEAQGDAVSGTSESGNVDGANADSVVASVEPAHDVDQSDGLSATPGNSPGQASGDSRERDVGVPAVASEPDRSDAVLPDGAVEESRTKQAERTIVVTREHVIEAGDSMRSISLTYYGVPDGIDHILQANPGFNPRRARIGRRLIIPPFKRSVEARPEQGEGGARTPSGVRDDLDSRPAADTSHMQRYIVRRGDTLTGIARRFLGDALRWREVYELNRTVIKDADDLRIGMVLIIPDP